MGAGGAGVGRLSAWAITADTPLIVTVPLRAAPVFGATVTATDPGRVPLAFAGSAIHGTSAAAVQAQPVSVSMAIVTAPPLADTDVFAGVTV